MNRVLEGIRVLDFGRFVAGPYCATLLGDFGAEVIRVERVGGSEDRWIAPVSDQGEGALFLQINRNKQSITLDLRKPGASAILERLVASADVVVTNVPAPALEAMGLDSAALTRIKPDIIHANVSSFGASGPWRERGGFDSVGQAMCGSVYLSGEEGSHHRTPVTWVDHAAGLYAALGVMMALFERQKSGRGQSVEASLLGSALSFASTYLIEQAVTGIGREAIGNRSFVNGPTDMFATRDGWIVTQVVGEGLFRRWARLMEELDWMDDPRFASDTLRGDNGAILSERTSRWCAERSSAEALDSLSQAGIPAGPVLSPQQALDHEQVRAMELFQPTPCPGVDAPVPLLRTPLSLSVSPPTIDSPPPSIGQHNEVVLGALGFSAAEIIRFGQDGII
jgi:crotonobetainyl-CoA:carnitine CoA-transferase CaiB-like acyl-CoA transferase